MFKWSVLFGFAALFLSCSYERTVSVETKKAVPGDVIKVAVISRGHFLPGGFPSEVNFVSFDLINEKDQAKRYKITKLMTSSNLISFRTSLRVPKEAEPGFYQLVLSGQEVKGKCPNPQCLEIALPSRQSQ